MADNVDLQAERRKGRGKNDSRRLRASGMVPAVLYGENNEAGGSTPIAVPTKTVDYTLSHFGDNALYNLTTANGSATARVVDAQRDPVSGRLVHVDFAPVNMRERIEVTVPLAVVGDAPGVEEGGVLQQVAYELEVVSLPGDIPQEITLDVSSLEMNENLTLGDITLPEGVALISEPEEVAATITAPTEITEEEIEAAGIVEEESEEPGEEAAEGEEAGEASAGDTSGRKRVGTARRKGPAGSRTAGDPCGPPLSWAWETRAALTRAPATTRDFWWPTSSFAVTVATGGKRKTRRPPLPLSQRRTLRC